MTEQSQIALYEGVNIEQAAAKAFLIKAIQGQVPHLKIYY